MTIEDRRLIEDYLPIKAISKEASRQKSIRKGHLLALFHFLHLVGNFQIDWKESERILKDVTEKGVLWNRQIS
jgi:hypothetical protein